MKLTKPALRSFVSKRFLNNNTATVVISGGAIHAAETPAINAVFPSPRRTVPVTYAALFTGPPISKAHIHPITRPRRIGFESWNPFKKTISDWLIPAIGLTITLINSPVIKTPNSGYKKIAFKPSNAFGNALNNFSKRTTKYPAKKPPMIPPRNPAPPLLAIKPATKPLTNAGRLPILCAM